MMFISNAFATTVDSMAQNAPGGGDWIQLLLQIALVFLVLYLLLIRPQQKRFKEHEKALNSIKKGTKVILHAEDNNGNISFSIENIKRSHVLVWLSLIFCSLLIYGILPKSDKYNKVFRKNIIPL